MKEFNGTVYFIAPKNRDKWYYTKKITSSGRIKRKRIWEKCFESWQDSSFKIELLSDTDDVNDIIKTYDPEIMTHMMRLPIIYRIDYAKYLLLGNKGGGYSDIDINLDTDFRHLLDENRIYLMGNYKKSLQNSLMFSKPDAYWDYLIEEVRKNMYTYKQQILNMVIKYDDKKRSGKEKGAELKVQYLDIANQVMGSKMMKKAIKEYKGNDNGVIRKIVILPTELFNRSQQNPFSFTTHWCTGLWRKHGRIFGSNGNAKLNRLLKNA